MENKLLKAIFFEVAIARMKNETLGDYYEWVNWMLRSNNCSYAELKNALEIFVKNGNELIFDK